MLKSLLQSLVSKPSAAVAAGRPATAAENADSLAHSGDRLQASGQMEQAESAYRRAIGAGATLEEVGPRLHRVVAHLAQADEDAGRVRNAPGDGTAVPLSAAECVATLDAMNRAIAAVPAVMPSKFWVMHAEKHVQWIVKGGIHNFKRTVAHNYYNWLTVSLQDPQIARLVALWPLHGSAEALTDRIEDPGQGETVRVKEMSQGGQHFYRLGVSLLWDYTLLNDHHGVLRRLAEPVTGNPLRITRRGRLISQDLAHSVRERNRILDASGRAAQPDQPMVIGELGAGNGRLAHVFGMTTNCRYMIFDITPALLVSQWYIKSLFPDEKIFTFRHFDRYEEIAEELEQSRFAFFASSQLEKLPDKYFDIFINVCSLMEMRMDTIQYFFRHIDRVTRGHFYTKQWLVQNNREDDIVIERSDYPVPASWKQRFDGIDPINERLFEEVWQID